MPYAVITKDKPHGLDLRNEVRGVHLEFLDANKDRLLAAGAMIDDDGTGGHGGVIIVDTDERQVAEDFIANDPFTKVGLFESITVVRWRKAFFDFQRLI